LYNQILSACYWYLYTFILSFFILQYICRPLMMESPFFSLRSIHPPPPFPLFQPKPPNSSGEACPGWDCTRVVGVYVNPSPSKTMVLKGGEGDFSLLYEVIVITIELKAVFSFSFWARLIGMQDQQNLWAGYRDCQLFCWSLDVDVLGCNIGHVVLWTNCVGLLCNGFSGLEFWVLIPHTYKPQNPNDRQLNNHKSN
jgi:hypothetical protein